MIFNSILSSWRFYLPIPSAPFITTLISFIAGVTDWFDGYLARKLKQTTRFGAFLDPVADKVMVITALVLIVEYQHSFWITIPAIIMISREIIISALREWMAELGERNKSSRFMDGESENHLSNASFRWITLAI